MCEERKLMEQKIENTEGKNMRVEHLNKIGEDVKKVVEEENLLDFVNSLSKEKILENVICQLVNREKNENRLTVVPNKKVLDLVVLYRVVISEDELHRVSFIVNNEICKKYGISIKELDIAAMQNTKEKGFKTQTMASTIAEITGVTEEILVESTPPMYVLTNKRMLGGASVMLYPEEFEKIALLLNDDLYILPSSINEVIAVPVNEVELYILKAMVSTVNAEEVAEDEVLSESVYRYSLETGKLTIA